MRGLAGSLVVILAACGATRTTTEPAKPQSITVAPAPTTAPGPSLPIASEPDPITRAKISEAQLDVRSMQTAAEKWRVDRGDRGGEECPSAERLKVDRQLSASSNLEDPWGHPYEIRCVDFDTVVVSAGPDALFGTSDDIIAR